VIGPDHLAFFSKSNVMNNFFQKLAVVWAKIANFFANFFGENIFFFNHKHRSQKLVERNCLFCTYIVVTH
jgi:hypothetical protein